MIRAIGSLTAAAAAIVLFGGGDWPQFHGPDASSVSTDKGLPTTFSDTENVAWKAPLPGRGPSSPIVVGGRVVVTCSSGLRQDRLHVLCFKAADGMLLWHRQLWATGHTICNPFAAIAIATPASDGQRIFAFYASNDLACFDLDGNLQWHRGLAYESPTARNDDAMASSPRVFGDTVVVQIENLGDSFATGINVHTGETRWRVPLEHDTAWTTPFALRGKTPAEDVLLLQRRTRLTAHDPQTGRQLWSRDGANHFHATGTTSGDRIYLPCDGLVALQASSPSAEPKALWSDKRLAVGYSSPVVHDGRVYAVKTAGVLACADASDGSILWQLRLKGPIYATPVLAGGHLYAVSHDGLVQVVELGAAEGKLVGTSQIEKGILASPAVADGAIYFRSDAYLWKVATPGGVSSDPR